MKAHLFKLVHPEDTPSILTMSSSLFPEIGTEASISYANQLSRLLPSFKASSLYRKILGLQPLAGMQCRDGLFRRRNQVLVGISIVLIFDDFIELLMELFKLSGLGHLFPEHKIWRLDRRIPFLIEELLAIIR